MNASPHFFPFSVQVFWWFWNFHKSISPQNIIWTGYRSTKNRLSVRLNYKQDWWCWWGMVCHCYYYKYLYLLSILRRRCSLLLLFSLLNSPLPLQNLLSLSILGMPLAWYLLLSIRRALSKLKYSDGYTNGLSLFIFWLIMISYTNDQRHQTPFSEFPILASKL